MSERAVILDDHLLLRLLLGDEPVGLRPRGAALSTTGLWYHRLCRALADTTVVGSMSRSLGQVDAGVASDAIAAVIDLPDSVGIVSLRSLAWPMAELLSSGLHLNLLSLEALASAEHLGAEICLAAVDDNPPLRDAAQRRNVSVRLISG